MLDSEGSASSGYFVVICGSSLVNVSLMTSVHGASVAARPQAQGVHNFSTRNVPM